MSVDVNNIHIDEDSDNGLVAAHETLLSVSSENSWIVDSGATAHMSYCKNKFSNYQTLDTPIKVCVGDGRVLDAVGRGDVNMCFCLPTGQLKNSKLNNVLFVPDLSKNLISVSMAAKNGRSTIFNDKHCQFFNNKNECIAYATKKGNLYYLNCSNDSTYSVCENDTLWHRRLGHISTYALNKLSEEKLIDKTKINSNECEPCTKGKNKRNPFPSRSYIAASEPFEIIHSDVCYIGEKSLAGCEYFLTLIDDFTRYVWVFFLKSKSQVFEFFKNWKSMVENQFGRKIKILRSDNGGEYCSNAFSEFLISEGIIHQKSVPKNPEQNGVSERMNRTLVEMLRCMLEESRLPKKFWAEALNTAAYLRNRSPTKSLNGRTPFEVLFQNKPSYSNLRIFGCKAFAHIPKDERNKLDSKSKICIFLGYSDCVKGYRLFDISKNKICFSRDVIFMEFDHPELKNIDSNNDRVLIPSSEISFDDLDECVVPEELSQNDSHVSSISNRPKRDTRPPDRYGEWATIALADSQAPLSVSEALSGPES